MEPRKGPDEISSVLRRGSSHFLHHFRRASSYHRSVAAVERAPLNREPEPSAPPRSWSFSMKFDRVGGRVEVESSGFLSAPSVSARFTPSLVTRFGDMPRPQRLSLNKKRDMYLGDTQMTLEFTQGFVLLETAERVNGNRKSKSCKEQLLLPFIKLTILVKDPAKSSNRSSSCYQKLHSRLSQVTRKQ
jgi:hypothetical protein